MGTHNLCFSAEIKKITYTPVNPSFTIQKWGLRGSKLYRHVFVIIIIIIIIRRRRRRRMTNVS